MERVSGFSRLFELRQLEVLYSGNLVSLDGLSQVQDITVVKLTQNGQLCYILEQLSNEDYWIVSLGCYVRILFYKVRLTYLRAPGMNAFNWN